MISVISPAIHAARTRPYYGDPWLIVLGLLLVTFGLVMMTSASVEIAQSNYGDAFFHFKRQLRFMVMGFICAGVVLMVPTKFWRHLAPLMLVGAFLLLVAVLVPGLGNTVNGSTRWINLGFMGLQASEPAKVFLVVFIAYYLSRNNELFTDTWFGFFIPIAFLLPFIVLLLLEPDFGAVVVIMVAVAGMMFLAGAPLHKFLLLVLLAAGAAVALVVAAPYRMQRLMTFVKTLSDPFNEEVVYGSGYQLAQALIAFGRGEWFGVGLGNSIQKLYFLPEAHTDFVFAIIAEELGLVGVLMLMMAFGAFVYRAIMLGRRCEEIGDSFQAYIAYGLAFIFGGQIIINIAVNTGLLPTKGLTLPFLSYGGSSLIVCLVMTGMLLRIDVENHTKRGWS